MLSWDDYRLVLAVSRAGGLSGAASDLGVNLSTVFRRLERIESALSVRLFDRVKGNYQPTEAGLELSRAAERMEREALLANRLVAGRDLQLTGALRITTTEVLSTCFLARHVASFCEAHPGLEVEIVSDNRRLSLAEREADLALRVRRPKEPSLFGRNIGVISWGLYASTAVAAKVGRLEDLSLLRGETFVGWDGNPPSRSVMNWLASEIPESRVLCHSTSLVTNAGIAASGRALAPLPCILGGFWPGLAPIQAPIKLAGPELWLLTHQDLRGNARVRAFMDHLAQAAESDAELFAGLKAHDASIAAE